MENNNDNIQLGIHSNNEIEESNNVTKTFMRKRSSLKPRSSIKEPNFNFHDSSQKAFQRRITWNQTDENEEGNNSIKSPQRNYNESKTHFAEFVNRKKLIRNF